MNAIDPVRAQLHIASVALRWIAASGGSISPCDPGDLSPACVAREALDEIEAIFLMSPAQWSVWPSQPGRYWYYGQVKSYAPFSEPVLVVVNVYQTRDGLYGVTVDGDHLYGDMKGKGMFALSIPVEVPDEIKEKVKKGLGL